MKEYLSIADVDIQWRNIEHVLIIKQPILLTQRQPLLWSLLSHIWQMCSYQSYLTCAESHPLIPSICIQLCFSWSCTMESCSFMLVEWKNILVRWSYFCEALCVWIGVESCADAGTGQHGISLQCKWDMSQKRSGPPRLAGLTLLTQ